MGRKRLVQRAACPAEGARESGACPENPCLVEPSGSCPAEPPGLLVGSMAEMTDEQADKWWDTVLACQPCLSTAAAVSPPCSCRWGVPQRFGQLPLAAALGALRCVGEGLQFSS